MCIPSCTFCYALCKLRSEKQQMDDPETIKAKSATSQSQTLTTSSNGSSPSPVLPPLPPTDGASLLLLSPSMAPTSPHPSSPESSDATRKVTRTSRESIGIKIKAYMASLLTVGIIMPVVASLIAVWLYLASGSPIPLLNVQPNSPW